MINTIETSAGTIPQRQSQIQSEMESLQRAVEQLHLSLDSLEGKLNPVVRPEPENGLADKEPSPEGLVPVAQQIHDGSQRVRSARRRIDRVIETLEI